MSELHTATEKRAPRVWDDERVQILRDLYPDHDTGDIAAILGVSTRACHTKAHKIGIRKSEQGVKVAAASSWENGGQRTAFRAGQPAWNKGLRYSIPLTDAMRATQFKPGQLPHNTRADGEVSIRKDNHGRPYRWIRVSLAKWVPLARHLWETHHGPIPKGWVIHHKDGDTLHDDLDNLECISRSMLMLLSSVHGYTREMAEAGAALVQLKKAIKQREEGA